MTKNVTRQKKCVECKNVFDSQELRPLSRMPSGAGTRYACGVCYSRVMALRKEARSAHAKILNTPLARVK